MSGEKKNPLHSEGQRKYWRDKFRERTGARSIDEIRAEQAIVREQRLTEAAEKKAARKAGKTNRISARDRHRLWVEANREKMREHLRNWKKRNAEKVRERKRTSRKTNTLQIRADLHKSQRGKCAICRCDLGSDAHVDHIMPRKLGGSNARSNLQLTCAPCNLSKGGRDPITHMQSLGRLI